MCRWRLHNSMGKCALPVRSRLSRNKFDFSITSNPTNISMVWCANARSVLERQLILLAHNHTHTYGIQWDAPATMTSASILFVCFNFRFHWNRVQHIWRAIWFPRKQHIQFNNAHVLLTLQHKFFFYRYHLSKIVLLISRNVTISIANTNPKRGNKGAHPDYVRMCIFNKAKTNNSDCCCYYLPLLFVAEPL